MLILDMASATDLA